MEVQLAYSAILIISITTLFFLLLSLIKANKRSKLNKKLPPGPWKLPIIGSLHHLAFGGLPHHALAKLSKKHGPLMHLQLGQISAVVVSSPNMAKSFLKTHDLPFSGRQNTLASDTIFYNKSGIVFSPTNDHWRQMRKICVMELLSNARVKSFSSIREDEVSNLVSFIKGSAGLPINLSDQIYFLASLVTYRAAFGENFKGQSSLISFVAETFTLISGFNLGDIFPSVKFVAVVSGLKSRLQKIHKRVDVMLDDIIKKRREYNRVVMKRGEGKNDKEDLLDVLLRLHQENGREYHLTDNNIKAVILEMFAAGTETTGEVIEWAMAEMTKNPRVMEKAQSEVRRLNLNEIKESDTRGLHYLNLIIKETLRLHPPTPLVPKECTEGGEINGYTIPVKTTVIVNVWAIGRDPEFWEEAEKFIPERFENNMLEYNGNNFEYIPFGTGIRICPGILFGLSTVKLVLAQLLFHFNWKLPNQTKPEELDMTETVGITAKRMNPLHLIAESTLVESYI